MIFLLFLINLPHASLPLNLKVAVRCCKSAPFGFRPNEAENQSRSYRGVYKKVNEDTTVRNDLHSVKAYQLASDTLVLMPVNPPLKHCKASLSVLFYRLPLDGMLGSALSWMFALRHGALPHRCSHSAVPSHQFSFMASMVRGHCVKSS